MQDEFGGLLGRGRRVRTCGPLELGRHQRGLHINRPVVQFFPEMLAQGLALNFEQLGDLILLPAMPGHQLD